MDDTTSESGGSGERHEHLIASAAQAQERARRLRSRIASVAGDIATSEEGIARVLEESAALRPHAAERLTRAARHARGFAAKERETADACAPGERPHP